MHRQLEVKPFKITEHMKIFNVVLLRQDEANGVVEAKAFPCIDYNVASKLQNELIQDELKNNED